MFVHSLSFSPPKRFDGNPWTRVRVEESEDNETFAAVETLDLNGPSVSPSGIDPDPADPQQRSITTTQATLVEGYFRVVWINGADAESPPSESVFSPGDDAEAFISTEELSDYLGRDVTADAGAELVIGMASQVIRTFTEQELTQVTGDTIRLDGTGTDALLLPELPVSTVSTVEVGGEAIDDFALNGNGVLLRKAGGQPPVVAWPKGRQNVEVTYTHGYAPEDFPRDVKMVALAIAARLIVQGVVQFEAVGPVQVRYGVNSTDLTAGERLILTKYRR